MTILRLWLDIRTVMTFGAIFNGLRVQFMIKYQPFKFLVMTLHTCCLIMEIFLVMRHIILIIGDRMTALASKRSLPIPLIVMMVAFNAPIFCGTTVKKM